MPDVGAAIETGITTRPFAGEDLPRLWGMMLEFPECNLDDSGPRTLEEFEQMIADRVGREFIGVFEIAGELAGAFAFQPTSSRTVMLRGVCFAKAIHGTGFPFAAMRGSIDMLYERGIEKISARMFADNLRAWRFFQKLGAVEEGLLRRETTRAGELVDVRMIALFRET